MLLFERREQVLTATWTPQDGAQVTFTGMPEPWSAALERLSRDVGVRQYCGDVVHVDWVVMYDPDGGYAWLSSAVTNLGKPFVPRRRGSGQHWLLATMAARSLGVERRWRGRMRITSSIG